MLRSLILLVVTSVIISCGGGGGSNFVPPVPTPTPPPAPPITPSWQQGVFPSAASFKDQCAVVRTNVDINGDPYPDEQGTEFDEKMWLRSWSHDTYLWYDEITDQNPDNYASPQDYFDVLVTAERTASGAAKDNFHFYQSTEEYESFAQSGSQTGYGINWRFIRSSPPRNIVVATVDAGSSASDAGVMRGYKLLSVDGVSAIDGDPDFLNNSIFPSDSGQTHTFVFEDAQGLSQSVNLVSGDYDKQFVNNTQVINTASDKIGYVRFDGFQRPAQTPLVDSFQLFANEGITELVLDLRYNGGGLLAMSAQLGYMIAGQTQSAGRTFQTLQFNDKSGSINPVTGDTISPTPFYTNVIDWERGVFTNQRLPSLGLSRVYVITSSGTCSASEALINALRGIDIEVIQIGNTTCGKPFGFYPTDNCGTTYFTIQFTGVNDKGFGEYAEGFKVSDSPVFADELPGCRVDDDLSNLLGSENEAMLATALAHIERGACPSPEQFRVTESLAEKFKQADEDESISIFDPRYRAIMLENMIYQDIQESP